MTTIYITRPEALPARRKHEYYPTERALIRVAIERYAIVPTGGFILGQGVSARYIPHPGGYILDPGAGDGRWGQAAKALYPGAELHGVEKRDAPRPDGFEVWLRRKSFLSFFPAVRYGLICGNPPYGPRIDSGRRDKKGRRILVPLVEFFIRIGFDLLAPGGRMIYLLPLQLQAGKDRYNNLWLTHPPTLVAVVSPRPSFGPNAKGWRGTNGTDYGIYVWDKRPGATARWWATELICYEPDRAEAVTSGLQAESKGENG